MMSGRWVSVTVDDPVDGNDVVTTINVECQDIVQGALTRQLEHYKASAGTAILMDVKTGDIKAIANVSKWLCWKTGMFIRRTPLTWEMVFTHITR